MPANRLSMWTSYFYDVSPEEALEEIAAAGWGAAELSEEHGVVLLERGAGAGREFRRYSESVGVRVLQGHLDLNADIAPLEEATRRAAIEGVKRRLALFADVGIAAGVLHPGGWHIKDPHVRWQAALASLGELLPAAEQGGIVICLENCCSGLELATLLAATPPERVGVCLDTGHLNMTKENPAALIRQWGLRLRALHISDNDGTGDHHRLPGCPGGTVNWPPLAAALAEVRYGGLLNFELPGENRCPLPERRAKLAALKIRAQTLFEALLAQ